LTYIHKAHDRGLGNKNWKDTVIQGIAGVRHLLKIRNVPPRGAGLFLQPVSFFRFVTDLRYLKGYPVSLFLELDPLVAFATAITTHTIYMGLLWSLLLIVPTLLFGRIFLQLDLPLRHPPSLHRLAAGQTPREERERIESNRYRNCIR
jgi:hypothetical protein